MKFVLFTAAVMIAAAASGQPRKFRTVTVTDTIAQAFVDRTGDFYIQTVNGQIRKFDPDGNAINIYSNNVSPSLFDPRDGARLFVYFRPTQQYAYLNPSFGVTSTQVPDAA